MHDLGRMFADGTGVEADVEQSHAWYAKALSAFQTVERQRPNRYVEYRIGWMLLHGVGTEQDESAALEWLEKSAELKNPYAEYQMAKHILADPSAKLEQTRQAARAVYMYLKDHADSEGKCWPGIRTISTELRMSRSTVKRALDDLCRAELISKERRFRENGSLSSNLYRLK